MPELPLNGLGFFFDDNPTPMWVYEISSLRILKVNGAAVHGYGYTEKEFSELTINDLRDHTIVAEFDSFLQQSKIRGSKSSAAAQSGIWKHKTKCGDATYAEITNYDIKYQDLPCRIMVAANVTEKLRYQQQAISREQELIGTKKSLEALINNTEDQIWSVDDHKRYVFMNQAYRNKIAHLTGSEPKEGDYPYLHPWDDKKLIDLWNGYYDRALAGEIYAIISESNDPQSNELLSFEISFNPIYNAQGNIIGVGCFGRNITERLKTEKAIMDQNERLRHIASLTSHELRRPVASMLGLIAIMDRTNFYNPDNKEIIEHLLTVGNEIDEVIRLIVDKTFMGAEHQPDKYQSP